MKKKKDIIYKGIKFDSKEELEFYWWLEEAVSAGFVFNYTYQPETFELIPRKYYTDFKELKTTTKEVDRFLLHPFKYTPDYSINFTKEFFLRFPQNGIQRFRARPQENRAFKSDSTVIVDVKGEYNLQNHHRIFSITQKVVFHQAGVFVNMIVPEKFFPQTWVPEKAAYMKNRRELTRRKPYAKCRLLKEVV